MFHAGFGSPSGFWQIGHLTPSGYLTGLLAVLLGSNNPLFFWKLSVIADQLVFATGVYWLSRFLYRNRISTFFVTAGAILATVWIVQIWFNFRIAYLMPICLLGILLFVDREQSRYLWLSAAIFAISLIGNTLYTMVFPLAALAVFGAGLMWGRWHLLKASISFDRKAVAAFALFVVVAVTVLAHTSISLRETHANLTFRDPETHRVTLENFLTHGGRFDAGDFASALFTGSPQHVTLEGSVIAGDNSFYIGILPLALLIVFAFHVRGRAPFALLAAWMFLFWLGVGGLFSSVIYTFPPFSQVRHIALLFALQRVFLFLLAGFALDRCLSDNALRPIAIALLGCVALMDVFGTDAMYWLLTTPIIGPQSAPALPMIARGAVYAVCAFAILAVAIKKTKPDYVVAALIACFVADLAYFQHQAYSSSVQLETAYRDFSATARPSHFEFRGTRGKVDAGRHEALDQAIAAQRESTGLNELVFAYANVEPCISPYRNTIQTRYSAALQELMAEHPLRENDFRRLVACGAPKIRLVQNPVFTASEAEMAALIARGVDTVILSDSLGDRADVTVPLAMEQQFKVESFSANHVRIATDTETTGWLIYADSYHTGWRATIDGAPTDLLRANIAMKAVELPAGAHVVELRFDQFPYAFLSNALALIGICALPILMLAGPLWTREERKIRPRV